MKYVYLINIENTNIYKIGFTKQSPKKRLKSLQTGNPYKMILTDSYESEIATNIEFVIHNYLRHKKTNSEDVKLLGEWFELDKKDVETFKELCQTIEGNIRCINNNTLFF